MIGKRILTMTGFNTPKLKELIMLIGPYREEKYKGDPWHPKLFIEGKINTLPYEHDSVVLYTGITDQIFWVESETFDECRNQKSALKTEYLYAGNSYYEQEKIDLTRLDNEDPGIWLGCLSIARIFAEKCNSDSRKGGGAVLELQVPSSDIGTLAAKKSIRQDDSWKNDYTVTDFVSLPNNQSVLKEFDERKFSNPRKAYRHYLKLVCNARRPGQGEIIHWAVPHEVSINQITGVWDLAYSQNPMWESKQKYMKTLKERWPNKMPSGISDEKIKRHVTRETKDLEKIRDIADNLTDKLRVIEFNARKSQARLKHTEYYKDREESLLRHLLDYQSEIKELNNLIYEELEQEIAFEEVDSINKFFQEIEYWHNHSRDLHDEVDKMIEELKSDAINSEWTAGEIKNEIKFEEKVEEELLHDLSKLPDFEPLVKFLKENDLRKHSVDKISRELANLLERARIIKPSDKSISSV